MAHVKNSNRSKRKYGDAQKSRTARNKANRLARHNRRLGLFAERAEALFGEQVIAAGQKGTVIMVVMDQSPREFHINLPDGTMVKRSRRRIKTTKGIAL